MDKRTGEIMDKEELRKKLGEVEFAKHAVEIDVENLSRRRRRMLEVTGRTRVGRNEKCPCGSGKKFKKCCLAKTLGF